MSEELNPELEGQIQEQAAEAAATPEVEVAEVAAAVEAVEDGSDEDELELVLEPEEEEVAFDWNAYETGYGSRSEEHKALEQLYEATLVTSVEHQVVNGIVVQLTDRDAIIDISSKSEGVVSLNEFRYNPDLKVGDVVEVLVDKQEDKLGQLVLSHRKARSIKAWDRVNEAFEAEEIVQGYVKARTKGGMIVDVFGLEAFLPGSQIDVKPIRDYDIYVDKTMEFKIVKI
ncbi:MAG: S1 RNA-binding domain-containing protein, partial [Schleiferiaceae bacterium]